MSPETFEAARRVVTAGSAAGVTVGAAESCTGGLVCGAITAVAGSSEVLRGGVVSYDPDIKVEVLGVSRSIIDDPEVGVVSGACAEQMACGARRVLSCDVAVSVRTRKACWHGMVWPCGWPWREFLVFAFCRLS